MSDLMSVLKQLITEKKKPGLSEEEVRKLEEYYQKNKLNEITALQLLKYYQRNKNTRDTTKLLEQVLALNLRNRKIYEFAIEHYLFAREYNRAFRYSEDLCYQYDRYGISLLQLARIALLENRYNLASIWLHEYIQNNTYQLSSAYYLLGICSLRKRLYRDAYYYYNQTVHYLKDTLQPNTINWLSEIVIAGRRPPRQNWFGRKTTPMSKLNALDWKHQVLNKSLKFRAKSIADIDQAINNGTYVSDSRLFGTADFWQIPAEFEKNMVGDCEDFALWVWVQLLRMNVNARFVLGGFFSNNLNHAWVCIYSKAGVSIFECTPSGFNVAVSAIHAPEYYPLISLDKSLNWYQH